MANNYSNELMEVNGTSIRENNKKTDENTLKMMENATEAIIGLSIVLSKQIAENNAAKYKAQADVMIAKYKAQADVMIADIQAKMQEEFREIEGYYNLRADQEKHFNTIVTSYREQINKITDAIIQSKDNSQIEFLIHYSGEIKTAIDDQLKRLADNIMGEQNSRLANSKSRRKGLFGFFKK